MAVFCGALAGVGALARALDRDLPEYRAIDLAVLALATFKITCARCVGTRVAAGLGTTQIVAPRFGRLSPGRSARPG